MTNKQNIKRFIAGAVCPRCSEMDKLMMFKDDDDNQVRECVRCGYSDVMTDSGTIELTTRVNQPRPGEDALAHEDEIQFVNIMDPKKNPGAERKDH